ncbi:hypothetical protein, variant [Exophiala sideris]|uniref:Uncharacterized protein n=1 Tax=Exophiala sideris TaxID=1016849 RepID=A0A0D1WUM0_9EURO|nr:hypothetical protein, variant [Exophiala sideris]
MVIRSATSSSCMSTTDIIRAYRQLYRTALRAIRYARPARLEVRDILRESFRTQPSSAFNARRIDNTLRFLETAGTHNGTEHKILKNLLHLQFWRWHGSNKALYEQMIDCGGYRNSLTKGQTQESKHRLCCRNAT